MVNMKKILCAIIAFLAVFMFFSFNACSGSSQAKAMKEKIKPGMSATEVAALLRSNEKGHYYIESSVFDKSLSFNEFENVLLKTSKEEDSSIVVKVVFVGPGYLKNEFNIILNSLGTVKSITPIKKWD